MKTFLRQLLIAALPLVGGVGAGVGFAAKQGACGAMVGTLFPAKCHRGQIEWPMQLRRAGGTAMHHVWFHGDTQVGDMELQVGGWPWRTWSRKTVPADWTGAWHVEVRDAAGAVLKRIDFTVGQ